MSTNHAIATGWTWKDWTAAVFLVIGIMGLAVDVVLGAAWWGLLIDVLVLAIVGTWLGRRVLRSL